LAGQCDGVEFEKEGSQLTANNLNNCGISGAEYDAAGMGLGYGDFSRMGRTKWAEFPLGMEKKRWEFQKKDGAPSRAKA